MKKNSELNKLFFQVLIGFFLFTGCYPFEDVNKYPFQWNDTEAAQDFDEIETIRDLSDEQSEEDPADETDSGEVEPTEEICPKVYSMTINAGDDLFDRISNAEEECHQQHSEKCSDYQLDISISEGSYHLEGDLGLAFSKWCAVNMHALNGNADHVQIVLNPIEEEGFYYGIKIVGLQEVPYENQVENNQPKSRIIFGSIEWYFKEEMSYYASAEYAMIYISKEYKDSITMVNNVFHLTNINNLYGIKIDYNPNIPEEKFQTNVNMANTIFKYDSNNSANLQSVHMIYGVDTNLFLDNVTLLWSNKNTFVNHLYGIYLINGWLNTYELKILFYEEKANDYLWNSTDIEGIYIENPIPLPEGFYPEDDNFCSLNLSNLPIGAESNLVSPENIRHYDPEKIMCLSNLEIKIALGAINTGIDIENGDDTNESDNHVVLLVKDSNIYTYGFLSAYALFIEYKENGFLHLLIDKSNIEALALNSSSIFGYNIASLWIGKSMVGLRKRKKVEVETEADPEGKFYWTNSEDNWIPHLNNVCLYNFNTFGQCLSNVDDLSLRIYDIDVSFKERDAVEINLEDNLCNTTVPSANFRIDKSVIGGEYWYPIGSTEMNNLIISNIDFGNLNLEYAIGCINSTYIKSYLQCDISTLDTAKNIISNFHLKDSRLNLDNNIVLMVNKFILNTQEIYDSIFSFGENSNVYANNNFLSLEDGIVWINEDVNYQTKLYFKNNIINCKFINDYSLYVDYINNYVEAIINANDCFFSLSSFLSTTFENDAFNRANPITTESPIWLRTLIQCIDENTYLDNLLNQGALNSTFPAPNRDFLDHNRPQGSQIDIGPFENLFEQQ